MLEMGFTLAQILTLQATLTDSIIVDMPHARVHADQPVELRAAIEQR
jgi:hypothetical protein